MATEDFSLVPRGIFGKMRFVCERWLYRRGFSNADARTLVAVQFMALVFIFLVGLAISWHTLWVLWAGAGASLALVNFYFVAQKIHTFLSAGFARKQIIKFLLNFYLRLALTGVLLFVFIVVLKAPVGALLVGLSLSAVAAVIFGLTKLRTLRT